MTGNTVPTHTITVTIEGRYPHGKTQRASVSVDGDGTLDHMVDTFQAAIVAAGYMPSTAGTLRIGEVDE